jgi:Holliday junction resolvase RusA-like endonuclease
MKDRVYKFVVYGRPLSQKNNIKVQKRGKHYAVGHSSDFTKRRDEICADIHQQFLEQGGEAPIDYLVEIWYKFYHRRQWEPDLDNLPAVLLDAMQGRKVKRKENNRLVKDENGKQVYDVLDKTLMDDKLVRFQMEEKIVKGDEKWDDEERSEFIIRPYDPTKDYFQED